MPQVIDVPGQGQVEFPDGMTDDQIVAAIKANSQQPGIGDQFLRQLGLTARAGLGGLGSVANLALDPAVPGINATTGTSIPIPSQAMERTLSQFLPTPANATERIAQAGARSMIPIAGSVSAARAIPMLAPLAQSPVLQLASGLGGSTASQGAQELGAPPLVQTGAGLLGGVVAPTGLSAATAAARAALRVPGSLLAPFTSAGRTNTAARVYQNAAIDPRYAAENINSAPSYVPGVNPNTAELANDSGISALYKALRNQYQPQFADAASANDTARQAYLANVFGNQTDLNAAKAARETATASLRDQALSAANAGGVPSAPILSSIQTTLNTPGLRASDVVRKTLADLQTKIVSLTDENGIIDANDLYTIRKEIGNTISGFAKESNNWDKRLTAGLESGIQRNIDGAIIGAGGKTWPAYLQQYADQSRGISGMETGQQITSAATNPLSETLSPPSFARNMANNVTDVAAAGPYYSDALARVNMDLRRSVAPSNTMRAAGSDTTQNLVGTGALQSMLGHGPTGPVGKVAGKLLSLVYSPLEQQTRQLVLNGMLDPRLGASLLTRPIPQRQDLLGGLLAQRLPISYGGLLGTISAQ